MLYPVWFALCVLFLASSVTIAKECRHTKAVMESAELVKNAQVGGHVWIHVFGLRAPLTRDPKHQPEVGKTMFASPEAYYDAWTAFISPDFRTRARLSNCGGRAGGLKDCIPAADLGIAEARVCTRVDRGVCTATEPAEVLMVGFWYANSNGKWILNTAYPSADPNCY